MIKKGILKKKLAEGEVCYGHWSFLPYPEIINIVGLSGFDFVVIDMEHSFVSFENLPNLLNAAAASNITALVRIPSKNTSNILRTLDTGAYGIVIPHCESIEQIKKITKDSKYFPIGSRGMAKSTKSGGFTNKDFQKYMVEENNNLINVACLESKKSIENLDQILQFEEIDVFYIGIYDLSASLGHPGETENPIVLNSLEGMVKRIKSFGKSAGTYTDNDIQAKRMKNMGINFLTCQADGCLIRESYEKLLSNIKK